MIQRFLALLCNNKTTLGELQRKAEDGTITVAEFWLYLDMLTAAKQLGVQ